MKPSRILFAIVATLHLIQAELNVSHGGVRVSSKPLHVHLSYGNDPHSELVVLWTSQMKPHSAMVKFDVRNSDHLRQTAVGRIVVAGDELYVCRVTLEHLQPDTDYTYEIVSGDETSQKNVFHSLGPALSPQFIFFGELGAEGSQRLWRELHNWEVVHRNTHPAAVFGLGTIQNVDAYLSNLEDILSSVPFFPCDGVLSSLDPYRQYFSFPNSSWPFSSNQSWFSLDIGPIHFVSLSSELIPERQAVQRRWLQQHLSSAMYLNDWVVVCMHRPVYCPCPQQDWLDELEPVMGGVDLVLSGAPLGYFRSWSVARSQIVHSYVEAEKPVHINIGMSGPRSPLRQDWIAVERNEAQEVVFALLTAPNDTHLHWQAFRINGSVLDHFWIVKESNVHRFHPLPYYRHLPFVVLLLVVGSVLLALTFLIVFLKVKIVKWWFALARKPEASVTRYSHLEERIVDVDSRTFA